MSSSYQKKATELDQKIQSELGIDIKSYQNEEVISTFVDLLFFPQYAFKFILWPVLGAVVSWGLVYYLVHPTGLTAIAYLILGFILFFVTGIFSGLWLLTWRLRVDFLSILDETLNVVRRAAKDVKGVRESMTRNTAKSTFSLLFQGVIFVIIIPTISRIIADKVPFVGGWVEWIVSRTLAQIATKVDFGKAIEESSTVDAEGKIKNWDQELGLWNKVGESIHYVVGLALSVVQLPIKIMWGISTGFLILLLLLVT